MPAPHLFDEAKLGVLAGSTIAALLGVIVLTLATRPGLAAAVRE